MANAGMRVVEPLRRWLNELWCQHVTGEPLPQFEPTPTAFRAGLWNETMTAYCAVLHELGVDPDAQRAWAVQQKRKGSRARARLIVDLIEAYADQLCTIVQVGGSLTPLDARRSGNLNEKGANLALGALLVRSGLTIAAAESRFGSAPLVPLGPKVRLFVRIDDMSRESIPTVLTWSGHPVSPSITYYRQNRRLGDDSSTDLPHPLWEVPWDQAALYTIGGSTTSPYRASTVPNQRSRRGRKYFHRMAQVLCPAMWELVQHPTWQADQRAYDRILNRMFIFAALALKMPWETTEHYVSSGVMDRYDVEIFNAIVSGGELPKELPPGLTAKIRKLQDELQAGKAPPALQRFFDHYLRSSRPGPMPE